MKFVKHSMCPGCESPDIEYLGIEDGCGDYGDELCDTWECWTCGLIFDRPARKIETVISNEAHLQNDEKEC
jgi:hypothetical protein